MKTYHTDQNNRFKQIINSKIIKYKGKRTMNKKILACNLFKSYKI